MRILQSMGRLLIGTSGYVYRHWRGLFYPPGLASSDWLPFFARVFPTCELNNTFYRLPTREAVARWKSSSPRGFVWAAKGSRYLTHMKKLNDVSDGLHKFFERLAGLGDKLQVVLWQLPPQMATADLSRLEYFLAHLPTAVRHVIEFRHEAWYSEETCALLDAYGAGFCEHDLVGVHPPRVTGGFRYIRFHGRNAAYSGRYGRRYLRAQSRDLAAWRDAGHDAYVYFNNDLYGHALLDAMDLTALVGERPAAVTMRARPSEDDDASAHPH